MSIRQQADFVPQKLVKDGNESPLKDQLENLVRDEVQRQLEPVLERIERLEALVEDRGH